MSSKPVNTPLNVTALRRIRKRVEAQVKDHPDVLGSMIGLKMRRGKVQKRVGITFILRKKLPIDEVPPDLVIPLKINVGIHSVRTDVVEWPMMVEQGLATGSILYDGKHQGTLTCFALADGTIYGLSCAHCLSGIDENPATPTIVSIQPADSTSLTEVGKSTYAIYSPGEGLPGNYGYMDAALFDLRNSEIKARASKSRPLRILKADHSLVGTRVFGYSPLNIKGWPKHQRTATIGWVDFDALDERCDFVLTADAPGTFVGDSGMLWLDSAGRAVAIHARGEKMPPSSGSRLITAMSAFRVANLLRVSFAMD